MVFGFEHSYAALPPQFFAAVAPTAVAAPEVVILNEPLVRWLAEQGKQALAVELPFPAQQEAPAE